MEDKLEYIYPEGYKHKPIPKGLDPDVENKIIDNGIDIMTDIIEKLRMDRDGKREYTKAEQKEDRNRYDEFMKDWDNKVAAVGDYGFQSN